MRSYVVDVVSYELTDGKSLVNYRFGAGNNLYALLTGLKPHYTIDSKSKFRRLLEKGETAFLDPRFRDRSFAESKLLDIIPLCWEHNPADRVDIFELVQLLREAVQENDASLAPLSDVIPHGLPK